MAIVWSAPQNHAYVGLEVIQSPNPSQVTSATDKIVETYNIWVKADPSWWYNDNRIFKVNLPGHVGETFEWKYVSTSATAATPQLVKTYTWNEPLFYDIDITGHYDVQMGGYGNATTVTASDPKASVTVQRVERPPQVPPSPVGLTATRNSDSSATISWAAPAGAIDPSQRWENVEIQRHTAQGTWTTLATVKATNVTYARYEDERDTYAIIPSSLTYTDNTLGPNDTYTYRVRALNKSGGSGYATTGGLCTTPAAPQNLVATKAGGDVTLTWTDMSPGNDTWDIRDGNNIIANVPNSPASFTLVNADPKVPHTFSVRAVACGLVSPWSSPSNTVALLTNPAAPTNLAPDGGIRRLGSPTSLTWTHNAVDATAQSAFEVQYRINGGAWISSGKQTSTSSAWTMPATTSASTVEWQVRTWGAFPDPSAWSNTAAFRTGQPPVAVITSPVTGSQIVASQVTATWSYAQPDGVGQASWSAQLLDGSGTPIGAPQTGRTENTATWTGLQDGQTYSVRVIVTDSNGLPSDPAVSTFTIHYLQPDPPTGSATWQEGYGYAKVKGWASPQTGDNPPTTSMRLERSIDGGNWEVLGTFPTSRGFQYDDFTATMSGTNLYRIVAVSDLPSESYTLVDLTRHEEDLGCSLYLSGGAGFMTVLRFRGAQRKYKGGRKRTVNRFSGRRFGLESSGVAQSKEMSVTAKLLPIVCEDGTERQATRDEIEYLFELPGPHLYRDVSGRRMFCSLSDVDIEYAYLGDVSFSCEEVDPSEPNQLLHVQAYDPPHLVEVERGVWTVTGGDLDELPPAMFSFDADHLPNSGA